MRRTIVLMLATLGLCLAGCGPSSVEQTSKDAAPAKTGEKVAEAKDAPPAAPASNKVIMEVKGDKVVIELRPDLAPKHVERVRQLVGEGFYNGLKFHRVMEGFMAQTGDPTGTGKSGSKYPDLMAEFTQTPFVRGTIGAARTPDENSANSQFFICFTDTGCSTLNGKYTVWGKVVEGMESVDKVKRGAPRSGVVTDPDTIGKMYLE